MRSNDKLLVIIAVAVTAVLCISGMYLILGAGDQKESVRVAVPQSIEEEMSSLFEDFGSHTRSDVHILKNAGTSFNDNADVTISMGDKIEGDGIESIEITISGETIYINFRSGPEEMVGAFINWLASKDQKMLP